MKGLLRHVMWPLFVGFVWVDDSKSKGKSHMAKLWCLLVGHISRRCWTHKKDRKSAGDVISK